MSGMSMRRQTLSRHMWPDAGTWGHQLAAVFLHSDRSSRSQGGAASLTEARNKSRPLKPDWRGGDGRHYYVVLLNVGILPAMKTQYSKKAPTSPLHAGVLVSKDPWNCEDVCRRCLLRFCVFIRESISTLRNSNTNRLLSRYMHRGHSSQFTRINILIDR